MTIFKSIISLREIISMTALLVTAIGVLFAYRQLRQTSIIQRATFFKDLYSTMFTDPDIRKIYYLIEYDEFIYPDDFHGSTEEKYLDRLLSFADLICNLRAQDIITEHEMKSFNYMLARIYNNNGVQQYLDFLDNWFSEHIIGVLPFSSFRNYSKNIPYEPQSKKNRENKGD
jgi:hypothetical protein